MNKTESGAGISVITPCYNHGNFIDQAINSVRNYKWSIPVEHIVINDGSTDANTLARLSELKQQNIIVIDQQNGGPAKARNAGIAIAKNKYVLPLDSDNWLFPEVFEKAFQIMQQDEDIAVVYTNAVYTGEQTGAWQPGKIDMLSFLACNQIDNCALIRKDCIQAVGGYDENRVIISYEDWELWIRMLLENYKFYYLGETGFSYRVINTSLSFTVSKPNDKIMKEYIVKKHAARYMEYYQKLIDENNKFIFLKNYLANNTFKSILKLFAKKPLV